MLFLWAQASQPRCLVLWEETGREVLLRAGSTISLFPNNREGRAPSRALGSKPSNVLDATGSFWRMVVQQLVFAEMGPPRPSRPEYQLTIAVGTAVAGCPPHGPGRALISASGSYLG